MIKMEDAATESQTVKVCRYMKLIFLYHVQLCMHTDYYTKHVSALFTLASVQL